MTTQKHILEKQIEALEKLNQLKSAVIEELEAKIARLESHTIAASQMPSHSHQWITPPPWQCVDGNPHQYPQPWGGTIAPSCVKCGQSAQNTSNMPLTVYQNGGLTFTSGSAHIPVHTSGYVQPIDPNSVTFYSIDDAAKKQSV